MRISDILAICLRNLTRRKLRTFLTALGVVIGVCLIIIAISIGIGLSITYDEQMASWGDLSLIYVYNWNNNVTLDDAAVAKMQALEGVDIATPFYQDWEINYILTAKNGRYQAYPTVYGVYPEALEKLGYQLKEGNYLQERDKEYSIVVGENFAYRFSDTKKNRNNWVDPYPDEYGRIKDPFVNITKDKLTLTLPSQRYDASGNATGKDIEVKPTVAGVMKQNDASWETTYCVFMDITEMKALNEKYNRQNGVKKTAKVNYEEVRVKCVNVDSVAAIQDEIEGMGYYCSSMNDGREMMQQQALTIQLVLGGLAGFSLLVAAIGIANTMIMSIYERTREIGVMKVIGAEVWDIRIMFLLEAGMIGLLGGILGVALSFGGSWAFNRFVAAAVLGGGSRLSVIPVWLVGVALAFSMLVGVVFGFLPANRAVKISALEAIKHD